MNTTMKENGSGEESSACANESENVKPEETNHEPSLLDENINGDVHVQETVESEYPLTVVVSVDGAVVPDDGEADKSDSSSPRRISGSDVGVVASEIDHGIVDIHGPNDSENPVEVSGEPSDESETEEEEKQTTCSKDCTETTTVSTESPEAAGRVSDKGVLGFDLNVEPVFSSISISSKDASDGDEIDSCEVSTNYSSKRKISGVGLDLNESPDLADDDDDASYQPTIFGNSLSDNMNYDVESKRNGPSSSQLSIMTYNHSGISSDACFQLPNFGSSSSDNMTYGVESNKNAPSSSQPPILTNGQSGNSFMRPSTSSQTYYSFMVDSNSQIPFSERLNSTQFDMNEVASYNAAFDLKSGSMTLKGLSHDEDSNENTRLSLALPGKRKEPEGGLELSLCTFKQQQLSL